LRIKTVVVTTQTEIIPGQRAEQLLVKVNVQLKLSAFCLNSGAHFIQRETIYRLLTSDQGTRLRQMASVDSQGHQMARAIDWLHGNFTQQLQVEELARYINMSTSTFPQHFSSLTAMSPLQYQKWLRLNEARRLMLVEPMDVTSVSFQVRYVSPSQFSREYNRSFGTLPLRNINNLRRQIVVGEVQN